MAQLIAARLALAALGIVAMSSTARSAESVNPVGVVELFTSQGCSSCPPADAVLGDLVAKGKVLALGYHVDYWDYLGWRDTLGSPENTARQYAYGKAFGSGSVYTPQAVVNGRVHVNGSNRTAVEAALADGKPAVAITVQRDGESYVIETGASANADASAHLVLVFYNAKTPVVIERGENRGSTVTYWNAVSRVQTAGMWHGKAMRFELPASEIAKKDGCAVLLQSVSAEGVLGPIIGAAIVRSADAGTQ